MEQLQQGPVSKLLLPLSRLVGRGAFYRLYPVLAEFWRLLDIAVALGALFILSLIYHGHFGVTHMSVAALTAIIMLAVYAWTDLYFRVRTKTLAHVAQQLLQAWGLVFVLLLAIGYLSESQTLFLREFALAWFAAAYLAQLLVHAIVRVVLHALRRRGFNIREVLLVGYGDSVNHFAQLLADNPWLGIKISGYVTDPKWTANPQPGAEGESGTGLVPAAAQRDSGVERRPCGPNPDSQTAEVLASPPLLGSMDDMTKVLQRRRVTEIFITLPLRDSHYVETLIESLLNLPLKISWVPDFSMLEALSQRVAHLDGQPILSLSDSPLRGGKRTLKRLEDIGLSAIMLLLLSPILLIISVAIKLDSKGPVLFKQQRYGVGGEVITVWKFRTMRAPNSGDVARQAAPADDRVTPIGRFLRRWSLDELPQLFNVLQGRMSMVGPRPHPLWLEDHYRDQIRAYMQRLRVLPGLTGWAQVNGLRGETDTAEKMEARIKHDLYYINHWSLWFDIRILFRTVFAVFGGKNAY